MRLDSIIFHTPDLTRVRAFYKEVLEMRVATCTRNGARVPDEDESYVNFEAGGALLCFERGEAAETGTVVLRVPDLGAALTALATRGIEPRKRAPHWAILKDPDGRGVILQSEGWNPA